MEVQFLSSLIPTFTGMWSVFKTQVVLYLAIYRNFPYFFNKCRPFTWLETLQVCHVLPPSRPSMPYLAHLGAMSRVLPLRCCVNNCVVFRRLRSEYQATISYNLNPLERLPPSYVATMMLFLCAEFQTYSSFR